MEQLTRADARIDLALALCRQGRLDEAEQELIAAADNTPTGFPAEQAWLQQAAGEIRAAREDHERAEELLRDGLRRAEKTDCIVGHGDVLVALAKVVQAAGRPADAVPYLQQAIDLYERKEATYPAAKARELLAELRAPAPIEPLSSRQR